MARKEQICVQVSGDVRECIRRDAKRFQFSQSECVRRIVEDFYGRQSYGSPIDSQEMDRLSAEAQSPRNPLSFPSMDAALKFLDGDRES
jgi:hypothetical protein